VLERNYYAGKDWTKIELLDAQGTQVGSIEYTLEGGTLKVEMMRLEPAARGLDLSTSLVAEALAKNPDVTRVEADFAMTNLDAFHDGGAANTPFYRSFSRLGFGEIAAGSGPTPLGYHIVLQRSY
jgi:hypothetical protein